VSGRVAPLEHFETGLPIERVLKRPLAERVRLPGVRGVRWLLRITPADPDVQCRLRHGPSLRLFDAAENARRIQPASCQPRVSASFGVTSRSIGARGFKPADAVAAAEVSAPDAYAKGHV
jgi:hypothetical protein